MTLVIRVSYSQLATSSFGSLGACRMIRVNADGSTVRPHPVLLTSYSCLSVSRKVVSCLSFPAITSISVSSGRNYLKMNHAQKEAGIPFQQFGKYTGTTLSTLQGHRSRIPSRTYPPRLHSRGARVTPSPWLMGGSVEGLLDSRPRAGRGGDSAAVIICISMASSNFISAADTILQITKCEYVYQF